eukprot:TRINITY_DN7964_c0_g2_i1.p1 TRINITY_DN7964_c0_g2~~TRINITY_DN7964_c0_g2_i1.p1  ORF type:complete len:444 (-),score=91.21 TRINITY_DN7964_c0_g2_i1:45-1376(-)
MKSMKEKKLYTKLYDTKKMIYASSSIMFKRDPRHYQNCDDWIANQALQYPIGASCAIVFDKETGAVGTIVDNKEEGKVTVKLSSIIDRKASDSLYAICEKFNSDPKKVAYTPISMIAAAKFNTTRFILGKVLGSTKVRLSEKKGRRVFNLGLMIFNFYQKLHVPYHAIYDVKANEWAVSPEVVKYLQEYFKRCPNIFRVIEAFNMDKSRHPLPSSKDLFPESADADKEVETLFEWMLSLPTSRLPFIPMGTGMIRPELYEEIKKKVAVESDVQPSDILLTKNISEVFVERSPFWIKPYLSKRMESSFRVGDRVISLKTAGSVFVPFGSSGTIIGINNKKAVVEFDQQIITGMNFYGMDGYFRETIVNAQSLFNLYGNKKERFEKNVKEEDKEQGERKEANLKRGESRGTGWRRSWRRGGEREPSRPQEETAKGENLPEPKSEP